MIIPRARATGLALGALLLVAPMLACGNDAIEEDERQTAPVPGQPAPDLAGLTGWINSDPFTLDQMSAEDRVVLIDFWTYSCVNCIRTLPFLKSWHEKYHDYGLTILGVHSPEFAFEQVPANVLDAVERHGIEYAVAQDNQMATWDAFRNRVWPAKYLVGADGAIWYQHLGEGAYTRTEAAIRVALTQGGHDVSGVPVGGVEPPERDPDAEDQTRELYGGYQRNYLPNGIYAGQETYYEGPDRVATYEDDGEYEHGRWYLQGLWRNEREAIVHARETEALEDYLRFPFRARSVNVVMHPGEAEDAVDGEETPYEVFVEIDGRPLTEDEAGADVRIDDQERSVVTVDEPRMYALVELPEFTEGELTLRSNSDDFSMYAVTFGAYTEGA